MDLMEILAIHLSFPLPTCKIIWKIPNSGEPKS